MPSVRHASNLPHVFASKSSIVALDCHSSLHFAGDGGVPWSRCLGLESLDGRCMVGRLETIVPHSCRPPVAAGTIWKPIGTSAMARFAIAVSAVAVARGVFREQKSYPSRLGILQNEGVGKLLLTTEIKTKYFTSP